MSPDPNQQQQQRMTSSESGKASPRGVPPDYKLPPISNRSRSGSEDLSQSYEQYRFPPAQISYQVKDRPHSHGSNSGAATPPPPGHHRVQSWSGHAAPTFYYGNPPNVDGSFGNAYSAGVPVVFPPGAPIGYPQPFQHQHQHQHQQQQSDADPRSNPTSGSHRRVQSYDVGAYAYGTYGSGAMSGISASLAKGKSKTNAANFSPKAEFAKLAGNLRSSSPIPSSTPPRGGTAPSSPLGAAFSQSPIPPLALPPRVIGMNGDVSSGPRYMSSHSRSGSRTDSGLGGEAVFAAQASQKKGVEEQPGRQSSRRMHMRQKSAQIFMQDFKGVNQTPSCRDIVFLMLFVFHLLGIGYLGNTYGYEAVRFHDDTEDDYSFTIIFQNLLFVSLLSGIFAIFLSGCILLLMMAAAKKIVQIALILTITLSFVWGTAGIGISPHKAVPITGIVVLIFSLAYTIAVWDRCKFHGSNLHTSLSGIRAYPGAVLVAFVFQFLALLWSIYFTYMAVGVYDAIEVGEIELSSNSTKWMIFGALAISYYWTLQVFSNILQGTIAGVIGSWWFTADGSPTDSGKDVRHSFFRSIFYSIGSICYGSLLVGPVRVLRQLSALFRANETSDSLLCFHECIFCIQTCLTSCVDNLAYRYNPFAFTYVGLYGYSLTDAGLHATELFDKRGWATIVSDDLVPNVLLMASFVIAGVTGCFSYILDDMESLALTSLNKPGLVSFAVGGMVGFVVSTVLFSIIHSSVNAVIVCFASSPVDFHTNHPKLSASMRTAWREVWPGCMDAVDIRMAVASYIDASTNGMSEHTPLIP